MLRPTLPLLLLFTASFAATDLTAQNRPTFRGSLGIAGGDFTFDSDLAGFRDNADAGLFQSEFEVTTRRRFGGGFRYEYFATDKDESLFRDPGNALDGGTQARSNTVFAHATYLIAQHRFRMPVRIGLFYNRLVLDDQGSIDPRTRYGSFGPMFELEPELTIVAAGPVHWTIYGQFGIGVGGTVIRVDGDGRDYDSASAFAAIEAGTRVHFGPANVGIAFVGRYTSTDRSDVEGGQFVFGSDSDFEGVLITAGFRF